MNDAVAFLNLRYRIHHIPGDNHHIIWQSTCIHGSYSWHKTASVGYTCVDLRCSPADELFVVIPLLRAKTTRWLQWIQFNIVACTTNHFTYCAITNLGVKSHNMGIYGFPEAIFKIVVMENYENPKSKLPLTQLLFFIYWTYLLLKE